MAYRTDADAVKLLSEDFEDMTAAQLEPHIQAAHFIVSDNIAGDSATTSAKLASITTYLAAHFATVFVREATMEKADVVAQTLDGTAAPGRGLLSTRFGRAACMLDSTGALVEMSERKIKKQSASVRSVGSRPSSW